MNGARPWWQDLYDDLLAEVLLVRESDAEVARTTRFVAAALDLAPGDRIFDQCCGIGSLTIPLARMGFSVVGVDLAEAYVARGRQSAEAEGLAVELHAADAFDFVPDAPCHGAINWWTSFGYADGDEQNLRMLQRAFESLLPGARFALDTMNVPGVLNRFAPVTTTSRETPLGTIRLTRESRYDAARGSIAKRWRYERPDGHVVEHRSSVRAYTPPELARLLTEAGFADPRFVGSIAGEPLELESPRCIAIAEKPASPRRSR